MATKFHIGQAAVEQVILEPHVGGRWYERGVDGSECDWGRVLAWEAPGRVLLIWQINGMWQFDPDPDHVSEIEARLRDDGRNRPTLTSSTATSSACRRVTWAGTVSRSQSFCPVSWSAPA